MTNDDEILDDTQNMIEITNKTTVKSSSLMKKPVIRYIIVFIVLFFAHTITAGYTTLLRKFGVTGNLDPLLIITCRNIFGVISTSLISRYLEGPHEFTEIKKNIWFFTIFGFIFVYACTLAFIYTVYLTCGSFGAIMNQTVPIYTYVLSLFMRLEILPTFNNKVTLIKPIGLTLSVICAIIICIHGFIKLTPDIKVSSWVLGTMTAIVGRFLFALYYVFQSKIFFKNNRSSLQKKPFTLSFFIELTAAIETLPFCIAYFLIRYDHIFPMLTLKSLIPILYTMITSIIVKALITWCNRHSTPAVVGCSYSIQVANSYILLYFFVGENLEYSQCIATVGVILGVFIATLGPIFYEKYSSRKKLNIHTVL